MWLMILNSCCCMEYIGKVYCYEILEEGDGK